MAANSLLYLLLATGLTNPPEEAVTTESNFGYDAAYTREIYDAEKRTIQPRYKTVTPRDQFTVPPGAEAQFCGENKHLSSCGANPACQKNCHNYNETIPCPMICVLGCICDDGFIRGPDGEECIRPNKCPAKENEEEWDVERSYTDEDHDSRDWATESPELTWTRKPPKCEDNEHFSDCYAVPLCQKNCHNYNETIICPMICIPGCICDEGFIRGHDNECIRPDACKAKPNAEAQQDVTRYEAEWRTRGYEDKPQDSRIFWGQESEYKTDDPRDQFTAPPVTRGDNADLWPLATEEPVNETERPPTRRRKIGRRKCQNKKEHKLDQTCDKTCSNYKDWPKSCPKKIDDVCVCSGGLVKNKKGICVPRDQCNNKDNRMAEIDDSHGCPYKYSCDVYCVTNGSKHGKCEGDKCKCLE